jgi:hypothetical protein
MFRDARPSGLGIAAGRIRTQEFPRKSEPKFEGSRTPWKDEVWRATPTSKTDYTFP